MAISKIKYNLRIIMLGCIPGGIKFGRNGPAAPGGGMGCKIHKYGIYDT